jgi:hypothetical protein
MTARIVIPANHALPRYPTEANAIFQRVPVLKPGIFLMNPKSRTGPPTAGFCPAGSHAAPFHFQAPSGDVVVCHFWPSQNHRPSGET